MTDYKGYTLRGMCTDFDKVYWKKNKGKLLCKNYIALDTETSHNHNEEYPECWVYQWSFAFNHSLYYGRKPSDLIDMLKAIVKFYELGEQRKILIFVHNLPYDFSYLCLYLYNAFGDPNNILATEAHKPFIITYDCGLEFRCSYKLSNDSLVRWGHKLGVAHPKLTGAIDYDTIRYQDSPLTLTDWHYQWTDCITLDECLQKQILLYNDNISTLPVTSTGYPRRELFRAYNGAGKHDKKNKERNKFKDTRLELETYTACYEEFSGGITHGNRFYKGKVLQGTIRHRDFISHYPTQQHKDFPITKFALFTNNTTMDYLDRFSSGAMILVHVKLKNIRLRSKSITLPYLQTSHVMRHHSEGFRLLDDNGRVVQFVGTTFLWLDFNELKLITEQYIVNFMEITRSYLAKLGPLPGWMVETIDKHFKLKSDLKDKVGEAKKAGASKETLLQLSLDLMKSKNVLNGIYGVSATNPVRQDIKLTGDQWSIPKVDEDTIEEKLDKYYKGYKHFMRYQWGIQTTILARLQLMEVYKIIGPDNFIYADTDSMFYFSTPEIEEKLDKYNENCKQWALEHGAYITTDKGEVINYNGFTDEGEDIIEFSFLHSKCYAYVTSDGKLHCTIAGVREYDPETKTYREDELGSIDMLADKKVFTKCGGTTAKYIETLATGKTMDGQETGGGCIINRTTKTLKNENWSETEKAFIAHIDDTEGLNYE